MLRKIVTKTPEIGEVQQVAQALFFRLRLPCQKDARPELGQGESTDAHQRLRGNCGEAPVRGSVFAAPGFPHQVDRGGGIEVKDHAGSVAGADSSPRSPALYSRAVRTLALLTAEEFARVAPVLGSCELVEGEIVPMSPGGVRHSHITAQVTFLLKRHVYEQNPGRVLSGEAGVIVARGPDTVRGADVASFRTTASRRRNRSRTVS